MNNSKSKRAARLALVSAFCGLAVPGSGAVRAQDDAPVQAGQNPLAGITFVRASEPREGAFSVSVPRGWKVTTVLSRVGAIDIRQAVQVQAAPVNDMTVVLGDPGLPTFATPTQAAMMQGHGEGYTEMLNGAFQRTVLHYMSAGEFNRWYLQNRLSALVDNLQLIGERPDEELSQNLTQQANANKNVTGGKWHVNVSVGATAFAGVSKETGLPVRGLVLTSTQLLYGDNPQLGSTWHANVTSSAATMTPTEWRI